MRQPQSQGIPSSSAPFNFRDDLMVGGRWFLYTVIRCFGRPIAHLVITKAASFYGGLIAGSIAPTQVLPKRTRSVIERAENLCPTSFFV